MLSRAAAHVASIGVAGSAVVDAQRTLVIPGPEIVIWWGVHVPLFTAAFGVVGVLLGHFAAPTPATPLTLQRQLCVIAAGILLAISIAIATGQRPLVVLSWSIGLGFSGITIFQTLGRQTQNAARTLGARVIERLERDRKGQE